jgi:hypothetical protein
MVGYSSLTRAGVQGHVEWGKGGAQGERQRPAAYQTSPTAHCQKTPRSSVMWLPHQEALPGRSPRYRCKGNTQPERVARKGGTAAAEDYRHLAAAAPTRPYGGTRQSYAECTAL